jgi:hypothetical protein
MTPRRHSTRRTGALSVTNVDPLDTTGPAFCPVEGCYGMALLRAEIAGYPAGYLCRKCASSWLKLWAELTEDVEDLELAA